MLRLQEPNAVRVVGERHPFLVVTVVSEIGVCCLKTGALAVYKGKAARIDHWADKISITTADGRSVRVREKDLVVLHPGPTPSLELTPLPVAVAEVHELLAEEPVAFEEFVQLACDDDSAVAAWTAWQLLQDGLHFIQEGELILARPAAAVAELQASRAARAAQAERQAAFKQRIADGVWQDDDREQLEHVADYARGQSERCGLLSELGVPLEPAAAHALLLRLGYWSKQVNPYPPRQGVDLATVALPLPALPTETRQDFDKQIALAIDEADNQDPDDAIAVDGEWLWVHVADAAALVPADSAIDLAARQRGASVYLPEIQAPMLPPECVHQLGLGLQERSPSLAIGLRFAGADIVETRITPAWVRVQRLSYAEADARMQDKPLAELARLLEPFRRTRLDRALACIDLPEVRLRVLDGQVSLQPVQRCRSRELVMEAMLAAGVGVVKWCASRDLPIPRAGQGEPKQLAGHADALSGMFARMLCMQPSKVGLDPGAHAGLGLDAYTRATSPLRRYGDLLVHQQIRSLFRHEQPLSAEALALRLAQGEEASRRIRRCERLTNQHWTLVWLQQHPDWQGEAVVVHQDGKQATVLLPELGFQAQMRLGGVSLDTVIQVRLIECELPHLGCRLQRVR